MHIYVLTYLYVNIFGKGDNLTYLGMEIHEQKCRDDNSSMDGNPWKKCHFFHEFQSLDKLSHLPNIPSVPHKKCPKSIGSRKLEKPLTYNLLELYASKFRIMLGTRSAQE